MVYNVRKEPGQNIPLWLRRKRAEMRRFSNGEKMKQKNGEFYGWQIILPDGIGFNLCQTERTADTRIEDLLKFFPEWKGKIKKVKL